MLLLSGLSVDFVLKRMLQKQFFQLDAYPIRATTCPHLLNLFPSDGWEWALSRLLYRRLLVRIVEEWSSFLKYAGHVLRPIGKCFVPLCR